MIGGMILFALIILNLALIGLNLFFVLNGTATAITFMSIPINIFAVVVLSLALYETRS